MSGSLRIAITADPYIPVPPVHYGGIERVVDLLVKGLISRGHEVTLLAHRESQTAARLVAYGHPPHMGAFARLIELNQVGGWLWRHRASLDVIHSFGRLAALLPVLPCRSVPKIQTYQRDAVPWAGVRRAVRLAGPSIVFTGCSTSVYRREPPDVRQGAEANAEWRTVFNGVDTERYTPVRHVDSDAPLIFLGRIERIKGTHNAIAIAQRAGRRLIIAGVHDTSGVHADYFTREIQPHVDGSGVCYVGPVDDEAKNRWLGESAALLMPIEWEEPFGIVMAEALACGTPVIGFPRGSVPEVVRDSVNGYIRDSVESAAATVRMLDRLDRRIVRADCETRFSGRAIVDQYERIYMEMRSRLASRLRADAPVAVR